MAFKASLFLLGTWLLGSLVASESRLVHLLLLIGLLVLLIAVLKARDAAASPTGRVLR